MTELSANDGVYSSCKGEGMVLHDASASLEIGGKMVFDSLIKRKCGFNRLVDLHLCEAFRRCLAEKMLFLASGLFHLY